jgi:protein arginine N-methyltransferase 1
VLPLFGLHIPTVVDARTRLLKPGGAQIPERDILWMALAEAPATPGVPAEEPSPHGVDLAPVRRILSHRWRQRRAKASELLSEPRIWGALDYRTVAGPDLDGAAELTAVRDGAADGILAWFETRLFGASGFSTAPGAPETIYGQAFFPFPRRIRLGRGDVLAATLGARLVGEEYVWRWSGTVATGACRGARFAQDTLRGAALAPAVLRKRADRFVPRLRREGEAQAWMLSRMDGTAPLEAIAREVARRFPDLYPSYPRALAAAGEISERFSH